MSTPLSVRVQKSAELLNIPQDKVLKQLEEEGITDTVQGMAILDSSTTTVDDLVSILKRCDSQAKNLQLKAAASFLKETDSRSGLVISTSGPSISEIIRSNRPIEQWADRELLERYIKDREAEVETELHKRAKQQPFLILKPGKFEPGKEEIELEISLELLKTARKRTNPSMIPYGEAVSPVYRITELNPQDRVIELCPICGESLYKGFCEKCQVNFSGIGNDERVYVNLVSKSDKFRADCMSDRKALVTSALKGLDDLKLTWPSMIKLFDELKLTNSFPRLKVIENRPSRTIADPFFMDGNRAFGNRTF